jgi:hypothetical protein
VTRRLTTASRAGWRAGLLSYCPRTHGVASRECGWISHTPYGEQAVYAMTR